MDDDLKKVFISYRRRVSSWFARDVFRHLRDHGFDVFMDVESIDGGVFPPIILGQIEARAHFLLLLEEGAFGRVANPGDWLRRELEHAIDTGRNIVPLLSNFTFESEEFQSTLRTLPEKFASLPTTQAVPFHAEYIDAAFERLRNKSLRVRPRGRVKETPAADRPAVARMQEHAASATPDVRSGGWKLPTGVQLRLEEKDGTLHWQRDSAASEYIVERSTDGEFTGDIVYTGPDRSWRVPIAKRGAWFRVRPKQEDENLTLFSPVWSTPRYVSLLLEAPATGDGPREPRLMGWPTSLLDNELRLEPKKWARGSGRRSYTLSWGGTDLSLERAFELTTLSARRRREFGLLGEPSLMALLERQEHGARLGTIVYAGCSTRFVDVDTAVFGCSYRVKLIDTANRESSWSNVVERTGLIGAR